MQSTNGPKLSFLIDSRPFLEDDDKIYIGPVFDPVCFEVGFVVTFESLIKTDGSDLFDSPYILMVPHGTLLLLSLTSGLSSAA